MEENERELTEIEQEIIQHIRAEVLEFYMADLFIHPIQEFFVTRECCGFESDSAESNP